MLGFRLQRRLDRTTPVVGGLAGLALLAAIFAIPGLLAARLDAPRAEREIRDDLRRQVTAADVQALGALGLADARPGERGAVEGCPRPDRDRLEFRSVEGRHFLLVPPWTSSRMVVVRAVMRDGAGEETRHFTLSARHRFMDFFRVAEQG